jgi:alanine racemase
MAEEPDSSARTPDTLDLPGTTVPWVMSAKGRDAVVELQNAIQKSGAQRRPFPTAVLGLAVLGLSALVLTGCVQGGSAEVKDAVNTSDGTVALSPSHGAMLGGDLVLVNTGTGSEDPITATFGEAAGVACAFDEKSARHACVAPQQDQPGTVNVSFSSNGKPLAATAAYTYTTNGRQASPVLTVNTQMVEKNAKAIRGDYPPNVKLGAVLEYGEPVGLLGQIIHDAAKPDYFFVPHLDDAIALREAGVTSKIAILYTSQIEDVPQMLHHDIEAAAVDVAWVKAADEAAAGAGGTLGVHLWIDTGMGREGAVPEQVLPLAQAVEDAEHLKLAGIATDFSTVTENDLAAIESQDLTNITAAQKSRFDAAVAEIKDAGLGKDALVHAGASDVLFYGIEPLYYDLMRIGGYFFGASTPAERVYSWTTELESVKELPAGWCIDYGCTQPLDKPKRAGTINHIPFRDSEVVFSVGGKQVPVLLHHGPVVTLDLSALPDSAVGDEVQIDFSPDDDYMLDATLPLPVTVSEE